MWVEVENNTDRPLVLLPTAIDPDYFAPLEVAFAYHKAFAADANAALDDSSSEPEFSHPNLIQPGSRASGYIFTNWSKGMKVIDVDLLGDDFSQNFTFFAPNPDSRIGQDIIDRMEICFRLPNCKTWKARPRFVKLLEQLPCCVSNENGGPQPSP